MGSKETYRRFCEGKEDLPLFMQPYWLDVTCDPGEWDVAISRNEDGTISGVWAYRYGSRMGMRWIKLPVLTPMTGIWTGNTDDVSVQKQIAFRQEVLSDLEKQLPSAQIIELKLPRTIEDWLPFYWKGYKQETRYTFLFDKPDVQKIHEDFSKSFRRNLRAAERHFTIEEGTAEQLHSLMQNVFEMRDVSMMLSKQKLETIVRVLKERNLCKIYAARDEEGVQAIIFIAWDKHTSYYLIGGRKGVDSKNGTNLLLWQAIQDAASRGHAFDFEGSMIEGVNRFFQNFGAQLTPYHYIYRYTGVAKVKYLF